MQQQGGEVSGAEPNGVMPSSGVSSPANAATGTATGRAQVNGGRFDFDDGGTYCGGWEDGKAHGHGVCTGPKGQGAYSGSWHYGFEVSGVYTWPSGSAFEGQWQNGKRHGLGVETRGRWLYRGEWTQGFKGRYGVRQSATSNAKYEGTWANGLQDGYGSETYADGGTYQGQWLRGMRHGYGVRNSAPFGLASHYRPNKAIRASLTSLRSNEASGNASAAAPDPAERRDRRIDDSRGGFVLKARSDEPAVRRKSLVEKSSNIKRSIFTGLKIRKQKSTGDLEKKGTGSGSIRSTASSASWISTDSSQSVMTNASVHTDSNASFVVEDEQMDASVTETYMGEWKNDKRTGFGISERSDGLRYEGEWFANKKYGYGVTTFRDGSKEEGKYKNNVLITSQKKKHIFLIRSAKFRERIDAAVNAAQRASKIALQKADIAISRTATARGKAEQADMAADHAREDSDIAQATAKQFAPDFKQPGLERLKPREHYRAKILPNEETLPVKPILQNDISANQIPNQIPSAQNPGSLPQNQVNFAPKPTQQSIYQKKPPENYQSNQSNYPSPTSNYLPSNHPTVNFNPTQFPPQQNTAQMQHNQMQQNIVQEKQSHLNDTVQQQINEQNRLANSEEVNSMAQLGNNPTALRRNSRMVQGDRPMLDTQQVSIDHFDHYKRPPSRDSSVDRYSRAAGRMSIGSRQPSVDKTSIDVESRSIRAPSMMRGTTPAPGAPTGNGAILTGIGIKRPSQVSIPFAIQNPPPFEDIILRKRNLGQDIIPSPAQPKRTESLYINPGRPAPVPKSLPVPQPLQRKKSLPDVQQLPVATDAMSREEVSALGSARREEIRRQIDESERLRANPLLYLVSPQVKDWFSRQQLVMLVLFINISLAIMFFKLLT